MTDRLLVVTEVEYTGEGEDDSDDSETMKEEEGLAALDPQSYADELSELTAV